MNVIIGILCWLVIGGVVGAFIGGMMAAALLKRRSISSASAFRF